MDNHTIASDKLPKWFSDALKKEIEMDGLTIIQTHFRWPETDKFIDDLEKILLLLDVEKQTPSVLFTIAGASSYELKNREEFCNRAIEFLRNDDSIPEADFCVFENR